MESKKIIIIAVSAVLVLALAGVGIYGAVTSADKPQDETTAVVSQNTSGTTAATDNDGTGSSTTAPVSTTDPYEALAKGIIGKWTDSANMSGYHFYEDGTVEMTYVNLTVPIINVPINGTSKGMYTLEGDKLVTKFSIYSATIENTYTVKLENNMLSMKDHEDGETATYARATAEASSSASSGTTDTTAPIASADDSELVGSWVNSDSTEKYVFNTDGTASITIDDKSYKGVYMVIDDTLTVQYSVKSKKVTDKYTFTTSKNTLSLEKDGDTTLLIRSGTTFAPSADSSLLGIWRDGANMSGYEFLEGGVAKVTFVNFTIPVVNMPINGTFTGSYSVSGDKLTVNYSIYGNSINDSFTFSVKDNVLTLVDSEGETSTYLKQ